MEDGAYGAINREWKKTCAVLLGQEIGELGDFAGYLSEMMLPGQKRKSSLSGKDVQTSLAFYPPDAPFVSQDEVAGLKFPPLSVNEIKDIDSLLSAAGERAVYCGNKLFGTNSGTQNVDNCLDCFCVAHSHDVRNTKYGAYLSYMREAEHVFGATAFPEAKFSVRVCEGINLNRCFETFYSLNLSDMYYAFNCIGCAECFFAFNLRSKRHCIGNLQLPRERYLPLKAKLLSELAGKLKRNRRIFSIADLAFLGRDKKSIPEEKIAYDSPVPAKVEEAWRATTRLVLGHEHGGIKRFGPWLAERAMKIKKVKGAWGSPTFKVEGLPVVWQLPADRLLPLPEALKSAEKGIELGEGESPPLDEVAARVAKIAFFSLEFEDGQNFDCVDTPSLFTGSHIYKLWDTTKSKCSAYSAGVIESEHIFGGYLRMLGSRFCINCFDSTKLSGCFEVDSSHDSRDSYFCHNCENVSDSMFCFNAKGLRYAVCNQAVGKEEFLRLKKILLDFVNTELEKKGECSLDIFAIPRAKRKK